MVQRVAEGLEFDAVGFFAVAVAVLELEWRMIGKTFSVKESNRR
jgi:hypothetical protein